MDNEPEVPPDPVAEPEAPPEVAPPTGWEKTPANEAWKRVLREKAARTKAETEAAALRRQLEEVSGKAANLEKETSSLATLRAELEAERVARAKAEARIPLLRLGIEDDEIGELAQERWKRSQSSAAEADRVDFGAWLVEHASKDKILAPHLQKQAAAVVKEPVKPPPAANKGTATATAPAGTKITWEQVTAAQQRQIRERGAIYDTSLAHAYYMQEGNVSMARLTAPKRAG